MLRCTYKVVSHSTVVRSPVGENSEQIPCNTCFRSLLADAHWKEEYSKKPADSTLKANVRSDGIEAATARSETGLALTTCAAALFCRACGERDAKLFCNGK